MFNVYQCVHRKSDKDYLILNQDIQFHLPKGYNLVDKENKPLDLDLDWKEIYPRIGLNTQYLTF